MAREGPVSLLLQDAEAQVARLEWELEQAQGEAHAEAAHASCVSLDVSQQARIARLEAELERDTGALQNLWDDFHIVEQARDRAQAANAAKDAALREIKDYGWQNPVTQTNISRIVDAALSPDAGEGCETCQGRKWISVYDIPPKESSRAASGTTQPCPDCAALDALKEEK